MPGMKMRTKDLRRICEHLALHHETPQAEPMKGSKLPWSYIRFANYALPILAHHGYIDAIPDEKKEGEVASTAG